MECEIIDLLIPNSSVTSVISEWNILVARLYSRISLLISIFNTCFGDTPSFCAKWRTRVYGRVYRSSGTVTGWLCVSLMAVSCGILCENSCSDCLYMSVLEIV